MSQNGFECQLSFFDFSGGLNFKKKSFSVKNSRKKYSIGQSCSHKALASFFFN